MLNTVLWCLTAEHIKEFSSNTKLRFYSDVVHETWCVTAVKATNTLYSSNDGECKSDSAELYVPLQRRYLGDCSGPVEAPVGPQSLHSADGALHRQDHGAGQELRPPDHSQTDLHPVSTPLDFVLIRHQYTQWNMCITYGISVSSFYKVQVF